jgi:uncharacterized repeat protein (TIGR03803 family)
MDMTGVETNTGLRTGWLSRRAKRLASRSNLLLLGASALAVACSCGGIAQAAPKLKVLYSFANVRGALPLTNFIADKAGNLYGTTSEGGSNNEGSVFELSPPVAGHGPWTETVLHSFNQSDGLRPTGGLIADSAGNLYGTTSSGGYGNFGVVYELTPPAGVKKPWTETVLSFFNGTNGAGPFAALIADGAGNLYGTTSQGGAISKSCHNIYGCGVVFELSPPAVGQTAWTETVLQNFNGPNGYDPFAALIADGAGNLYGTTSQGGSSNFGVVFELSPPAGGQTAWTETVLDSFHFTNGRSPQGGLLADGAGNLYGTTYTGGPNNDGVVFELSPPVGSKMAWTETVLHFFSRKNGIGPTDGLIADGAGNLYGTTASGGGHGDGVLFELSPAAGGKRLWTETVLHSFNGTDGLNPQGGLLADGAGNLYGTTYQGGANSDGVAFKLTP